MESNREQSWLWWAGEAPLLCYLDWALCTGPSKVVSTDLTQFPLKSIKNLILTSLEEQQESYGGAKSQGNAETINLETRKEVPDVSPRRNVEHAQEQQRAFVKEAAIFPVEAKEMLSPPTWAQDGHTKPNDCLLWKWPPSRVMHTSQQPLSSPGDGTTHPRGNASTFSLLEYRSPELWLGPVRCTEKPVSTSAHQLWCIPDLPDSIKCSRPWEDPQLPSPQKYQCRVVHEDNTFQPFSFIYHPWNSIYWCFDQENHVSPYLVPSATILLIFHICTREKRPDSACTAWPFAKENSQNNSSDLGSLWILVNHSILSSENQRRETWSDPRFLNLNRKPRFSF